MRSSAVSTMVRGLADGVVLPTDKIVAALEALILPGDRVVLEGNNQKQADFLSRSLAKADPGKAPRSAHDHAQRRPLRAPGPVRTRHRPQARFLLRRHPEPAHQPVAGRRPAGNRRDPHLHRTLRTAGGGPDPQRRALGRVHGRPRRQHLYRPKHRRHPGADRTGSVQRRHRDRPGQPIGRRRQRTAPRGHSGVMGRFCGGGRQAVLHRTAVHPRPASHQACACVDGDDGDPRHLRKTQRAVAQPWHRFQHRGHRTDPADLRRIPRPQGQDLPQLDPQPAPDADPGD